MVPWIPVKGKTYAPKGQKKISIQGLGDKRGNTATLTISKAGDLLPLQLIWEGKTQVSVPNYEWPSEVIHSLSPRNEGVSKAAVTKWQNGHSIVEYLRYVVGNYLKRIRAELKEGFELAGVPMGERALMIWDHHHSHKCENAVQVCQELNIDPIMIPERSTDLFCVLDISINKEFKANLKGSFADYCAEHVQDALSKGVPAECIKMKLTKGALNHHFGRWIMTAFRFVETNASQWIASGWEKVVKNISTCLEYEAGDIIEIRSDLSDIESEYEWL
ncbi:hypothetical protein P9112_011787 [Eukaryota sp. TZLM1-RC]